MKEIINWLRKIEHQATQAYQQAATVFTDDPVLKRFLEKSAEEEAWHYHVMGSAAIFLSSRPDIIPAISVDKQTNDKIVKYLTDIRSGLDQQTLSRDDLIEKIVALELTEWNDIFLYVVNSLTEQTSEFKYPASKIQAHIKEIEDFLEVVEKRPQILQKIKQLPPVWSENILIVDDEQMITDLIRSLLNRSGNIDVAHDGQTALRMIQDRFYKLIISDIDMPIIDGLTLFTKAVEQFPGLRNRFIFMTGNLSPEREHFFREHRIKYLSKPMKIVELKEEAEKILFSS